MLGMLQWAVPLSSKKLGIIALSYLYLSLKATNFLRTDLVVNYIYLD